MIRALAVLLLALPGGAGAASDDAITLPSGRQVVLHEVLSDEIMDQTWMRFRFIAPWLDKVGEADAQTDEADMDALCDGFAVTYLARRGVTPYRVVISVAREALPFGVSDPDVPQYFGSYRLEGDICMWEEY